MGVSSKHGFALSALGAVLFISSGCMAPVAFQAAGAIGGASPVAMNLVEKGKVESYWVARYADVVDATVRAGQVLSLELLEKKVEADKNLIPVRVPARGKKRKSWSSIEPPP